MLLIAFYNQKALGVRYLETACKKEGISVNILFFKGFNSMSPKVCTQEELKLLKEFIEKTKPSIIGLSVMSSLYLESVYAVNKTIRENFDIPITWGGVYPTLFPERSLKYADFVMRGEGEQAIVELYRAVVEQNGSYEDIKNIAYRKDGQDIVNPVRPLCSDLDELGYPKMGNENKFLIDGDKLTHGDPSINSLSYELSASRGCPFTCSYCCSINLLRLNKGGGRYVRFRSVKSVMDELIEATGKMKRLKVIHFWDEIFSDDPNWIDEFVSRYKKEINLPFEIWGHPLKVNRNLIQKLTSVGLYKIVMGIQSGSVRVRKEIFKRPETQEQILEAAKILKECKVPQVIFDFMLQHPFETEEDIKETYIFCTQLARPFELQLHGLNFLPGTDIVDMALDMKIFTPEQMDTMMHEDSMQAQYNNHWGSKAGRDKRSEFWYRLIFMSQFPYYRGKASKLANNPDKQYQEEQAEKLYNQCKKLVQVRYLYKKGMLVMRSVFKKV